MSAHFEELDWRSTSLGAISLRRRFEPTLQADIFEAKLDDEFLMSSAFTAGEVALADIALGALSGSNLDVVVGGLGLGYTARAVLRNPRVRSLHVVEALDEVIGWHRRRLLPVSEDLTADPRCVLVHGDFFTLVAAGASFGPGTPDRIDAVLVDIDHTPRHLLHPGHASFYEEEGQCRLAARLSPAGVYGLWSDDPPDEEYMAVLDGVFTSHGSHIVTFANPLTGGEAANTVYIAMGGAGDAPSSRGV